MNEEQIKIIKIESWRDAVLNAENYRIPAETFKEALERFNKRFPPETPHTCYWYEYSGKLNHYCFVWR